MAKKDKSKDEDNLKEFNIGIDQFGQIKTNLDIDKLNSFLNENVDDKKLRDRPKNDK